MSGREFVDPVAALVPVDPVAAIVDDPVQAVANKAAAVVPFDRLLDERAVQHVSTMRVWIGRVRAIVLPMIVSYTFTQEELDAMHEAREIVIVDKDSQERAWRIRRTLGEARRAIESHYLGLRRPFNKITKAISGLEERDAVPVAEAEGTIDPKILTYDNIARELEEKERREKQAAADAEAIRKRDEAAAAMTRVAAAETDPGVKAALTSEAAAIAASPATAATVKVESQRASVKGTGRTESHEAEIVDKLGYIKAVAAGRVPLDSVEIKPAWANGKAKELREQLAASFPFLRYIKGEGTRG